MIRLSAAVCVGLLWVLGTTAYAQTPTPGADISVASFDPDAAVAPIAVVQGAGVKVGEGTVLHPVFGIETGVVSNVFYTAQNPLAAGVLRLLAQIGVGSLSPDYLHAHSEGDQAENVGSFQYRADVRLSYDAILSGNSDATAVGGLGAGVTMLGLVNPGGRFSLGMNEDYTRLLRASNFETNVNTDQDINTVGLQFLYRPYDRNVSGYVYLMNTIDVFEVPAQQFADRTLNLVGVYPMYRILPQTSIYGNFSAGYNTGIGSQSIKATSTPLTASVGVATLLTPLITANASIGWTAGFYNDGPSYSDPIASAELGYRYSPLGRIVFDYSHLYADSINANYYQDDQLSLWWQQLYSPFVFMVQPMVIFRQYDGIDLPGVTGPSVRNDTIFSIVAGASYSFRNWLALALDYRFSDVDTAYRYMDDGALINPGYARHEVMLGLRIAM
jgi:hypothetical protein